MNELNSFLSLLDHESKCPFCKNVGQAQGLQAPVVNPPYAYRKMACQACSNEFGELVDLSRYLNETIQSS